MDTCFLNGPQANLSTKLLAMAQLLQEAVEPVAGAMQSVVSAAIQLA